MNVLGISAWYHDAAACLLRDGRIVAAAEEERFSRRKHDARFPAGALAWCLREGGLAPGDVDVVAFYDKPVLKLDRALETFLHVAPRGVAAWAHFVPHWVRERPRVEESVRAALPGFRGRLLYAEHHESHAASAFYPSPFARAAVLTMDGVGEWATASVALGDGADLRLLEEIRFPHSLGLLYAAFTHYLGFRVNADEYKVMGLAPYGEPRFAPLLRERLIDLREDGSFRLREEFLGYLTGLRMTNPRFHALLGRGPREPGAPLEDFHRDVARSIQEVTGEAMLRMARHAMAAAGSRNLCLAGGVALNCVGNGRILRESGCEGLWIQPAAGDSGGALGAALVIWHRALGNPRTPDPADSIRGSLLGPSYGAAEIDAALRGARTEAADPDRVAALLAEGRTCGWFQGRAEFGPRALGARSILADPRDPGMRDRLNLQVKERESFRPFAPAVLAERAGEWFDLAGESPYMLLTATVREGKPPVPAVTHVDRSARVQTVGPAAEPRFRALLQAFERRTGCPLLVNTSFNGREEPMVLTPADALRCFRRTGLDALVLGDRLLLRADLPPEERAPPPATMAAETLRRARLWNLLGLCTPLANLGMRLTATEELRWFGATTGLLLLAVAGWALAAGHGVTFALAGSLHVALVLAGLADPRLPEAAGRAWIRLGRLLAFPVLALLYFLLVTPVGLLVRLLGKDPIRRGARDAGSCWVRREPSPLERYERQF